MPRPQHYWHLKPGPARKRLKLAHDRYFDKIDYFRRLCKKWGISLEGLPLDVKDGEIQLCHTTLAMPTAAPVIRTIVESYVRTHPVSIQPN